MICAIENLLVDLAIWIHLRRIEHAETNARREEANEPGVHRALGPIALLDRVDVRVVIGVVRHLGEVDTLIVHAADERDRLPVRLSWAVVVILEYVQELIAGRN